MARQDEEIDDVIENDLLVYNNQLKFFDDYILKDKQKSPTKRISKPESSSSPLSILYPSQETIAERVKLKPPETKKKKTGTELKILSSNKIKSNESLAEHKIKNEIEQ